MEEKASEQKSIALFKRNNEIYEAFSADKKETFSKELKGLL